MVKATADIKKDKCHIKAEGTPIDIMVETTAIVREVYLSMKEQNPDKAENFRNKFTELVNRPDSPIWRDEEEGASA